MKYHSDFTTAIITIGILLVFALVSVFIISSLDMTSPTLLITQRLFTTLNEANSDIGVSFKNVSRNLQHQIVINELSLTYRGKDFLSFDRITVGTGLFQFLGYFVAKDNPLEIKFHNGKVFISEEMLKEFLPESENDPISAEHGSEFSLDSIRQLIDQDYELTLPSILYDYAFRVAIDSLSLEVENLIKADDTKLSLYWNKGFPDLTFDYQMPEVHVDMDDINIIAEDVSLNGYYTSNLVLNLSFGNTGGSFAGNEAAFKSFSLRISGINESSFSFNDLTVFSEINSISARNQVFSADLDSLTLNSYRGSGDIQLSKPVIEYKGMNVRLSSVSLGFSKLNSVALSLNGFDVRKDSVILAYSPKVDSIFNFDTKEVYLSTENIYTQLPGTITSSFINEVGIENVSLGISYSTNFIDVSFSSPHLYLKSSDAELDDAGADMNLTFRYGNNTLQNIRLVVDQIKYKNSSNSLRLSALGNLEDLTLNLISAGDNSFSLALLLQQDNIRGSLQSKDFLLDTLRPFINNYVPAFSSYISDRTAITGSFGFSFDKNEKAKLKLTGPIDSAIRIDDIHFNRSDFSADIEFEAELEEREFEISNLYFSSEIFDIEFSGKINFDDYLPTGIFRLYGFNDNKLNTFEFSFDLSAYKEYSFLATLPRFDNTYIKGVVNFAEEKRIVSDVYSEIGGNQYPLDLSINLEEKQLVGTSTYMNINASWKEILDFSIRINNLPLSSSGVLAPTRINNSRVDFTFDFANQSFTLDIPSFEIANIEMLPNTPTIKFNLVGNNDELYVENIVISSFNQKDITGSMLLDFQPNSFALNFTDGDNERIYGSVIRYNDRYIGGLRGEHINLERFGFDGFEANINLNGDALTLDEFTFSGKIQAQALDSANDLRIVETSILIDDDRIILSDVVYSNDLMQISSPEISLVSKTGRFEIQEVAIDYNRKNEAGEDLSIHFNMAVSAETEGEDTLLLLLENLVRSKANGLEFQAEVKNFNYASELEIPKASFVGIYNNGKIDFSGEFLNGYVDISSGDMDFYIAADPLISAGIKGNFKNFYGPNLTVTIDGLAVEFTNIFFSKPVVKFYNPSNLTGVVNIVFNEAGLDVFGELYCEYAAMDLFWLTNQTVILHNAKFVIWDNSINANLVNATIMNKSTHNRTSAKISLGLFFDEGMSFDSWSVDVYINDGEEVDFRVPITASNMDITGKVSGHYAIEFIGGVCYNRGDVTVDDAVLSVGMYPLPDWWVSEMAVAVDMNITLRKNVQAIYPLGSAPILRANLADNQTFRFVMEPTGELYTDGELMIRSGEFYYFQKNFYITSGSVNLRDGSSGVMDPVVSLRARLRTFDSEGEKVDIYLVLQDATLDNISPVFESSPSKDLNEIMSILGQAIISTGDNTNLVGNVVSLAATSVDFLSRMGIINTRFGSIDSSVKSGLSLDTFSLHTNILANVLTDTVTLWDTSIDNNLSPMARYLDGTTLYMGKYLTPEWYFQVMLHLAAERSINDKSSGFSFIADDLILDTEISIEWNAPICTITFFTQPLNLTAYSIFENYGISFTRRIIF